MQKFMYFQAFVPLRNMTTFENTFISMLMCLLLGEQGGNIYGLISS